MKRRSLSILAAAVSLCLSSASIAQEKMVLHKGVLVPNNFNYAAIKLGDLSFLNLSGHDKVVTLSQKAKVPFTAKAGEAAYSLDVTIKEDAVVLVPQTDLQVTYHLFFGQAEKMKFEAGKTIKAQYRIMKDGAVYFAFPFTAPTKNQHINQSGTMFLADENGQILDRPYYFDYKYSELKLKNPEKFEVFGGAFTIQKITKEIGPDCSISVSYAGMEGPIMKFEVTRFNALGAAESTKLHVHAFRSSVKSVQMLGATIGVEQASKEQAKLILHDPDRISTSICANTIAQPTI